MVEYGLKRVYVEIGLAVHPSRESSLMPTDDGSYISLAYSFMRNNSANNTPHLFVQSPFGMRLAHADYVHKTMPFLAPTSNETVSAGE